MRPELMTLLLMQALRKRKGVAWCKKDGVGLMRRLLGAEPNVIAMDGNETTRLLEAHCRACGRCKYARETITEPSPPRDRGPGAVDAA